MLKNIHLWLGSYIKNSIDKLKILNENLKFGNVSILFSICDHYEPYWNNKDNTVAYNRVKRWMDDYQRIASDHKDFLGNSPKHCFFYPAEEYQKPLLNMLSEICRNGFGETEIHLHHHNDTSENLKKTLVDFKKVLSEEHGLLSIDKKNKDIKYGFIHGNWALDNSRPDGCYCGVNDEISVLQETGCYADFTMPSAPSDTQTRTINSIYYAVDDPLKPKSHDTGKLSKAGLVDQPGLLCIQGPLGFNYRWRKFGIIPRIENGYVSDEIPVTSHRIDNWINTRVHVSGRPDIIFIKLYTHGTQENVMDFLFDRGSLNSVFNCLETVCLENPQYRLYYASARQMYNVVKGLENNPHAATEQVLDYELELLY